MDTTKEWGQNNRYVRIVFFGIIEYKQTILLSE